MSLDLDDLAEQAIRDTPTRVPAMSEVLAIARRRARRRALGRAATAASALAVIAGGLWAFLPDDSAKPVPVITDGTDQRSDGNDKGTETSAATPPEAGVASGVLPNGDPYRVESASLNTAVAGISAAIVLDDGASGAQAIGIATFQRVGVGAQPFADDEAGVVGVVSGEWMLHLSIYDEARRALGDDAATLVASWIDPSDPAHVSGLPSFELSAPLRWASDEELPLQMQILYPEFVVRRGCGTTAQACSDDGSLQVIAAEDVFEPAPSWPGDTVKITND